MSYSEILRLKGNLSEITPVYLDFGSHLKFFLSLISLVLSFALTLDWLLQVLDAQSVTCPSQIVNPDLWPLPCCLGT